MRKVRKHIIGIIALFVAVLCFTALLVGCNGEEPSGDEIPSVDTGITDGSGETGDETEGETGDSTEEKDPTEVPVNTPGLKFELNEAGTGYIVTGYEGTAREVVVLGTYENLPVAEIGSEAFSGSKVKKVTLSEGIKKIGNKAFLSCQAMSEIELPSTLTDIGKEAFANTGLKKIEIPSSVKEIGETCFASNIYLEEVILSEGLQKIGKTAFGASLFYEITIPASVSDIGEGVFAYCSKLKHITNLSGVSVVLEYTNSDGESDPTDFSNTEIRTDTETPFTNTLKKDGTAVTYTVGEKVYLLGYDFSATELKLDGYGITDIASDALMRHNRLVVANIPQGVKRIEKNAFYYCNNVLDITVPSSVTDIDERAFGFSKLLHITKPASLNLTMLDGCKAEGCEERNDTSTEFTTEIGFVGDFVVCTVGGVKGLYGYLGDDTEIKITDKTIKTVKSFAFERSDVVSVVFPEGLETVEGYAFYQTYGLKKVEFAGDGKVTIEASAFNETALTDVILPKGGATVDSSAFRGCKITEITLPKAMKDTDIGNYEPFGRKLEKVIYDGTEEEFAADIANVSKLVEKLVISLNGGNDYLPLYCGEKPVYLACRSTIKGYLVEGGELTVYNAMTSEGHQYITVPESVCDMPVTAIAGAFTSCIYHLTLPKTITKICKGAFDTKSERVILNNTTITYQGTKAEWAQVEGIYECGNVTCSDGAFSVNENRQFEKVENHTSIFYIYNVSLVLNGDDTRTLVDVKNFFNTVTME